MIIVLRVKIYKKFIRSKKIIQVISIIKKSGKTKLNESSWESLFNAKRRRETLIIGVDSLEITKWCWSRDLE